MECNKDEAIRAKGIAERKMQNDDFEGARKIARKAQQLFPELENIHQLIIVCDVHCSARNKICGSQMDWYGILQADRLADEVTIKKQYRKLALLLHPDKNKFPGAESAFKMVGEANMVLSDRGKRSLYDSKCLVSMRTSATKPPPNQLNPKACDRKQHVQTNRSSSNARQAFWTSCPFCYMRYQYYREYVNRALNCQNCSKPFVAYDLGAQNVSPGSKFVQPAFPQQKQAQGQGSFKVGSQNTGGFPPSHMGSQVSFSNKTVGSEPASKPGGTAEVVGGSTTKVKEDGVANNMGRKEGVGSVKVEAAKPRASETSRNMSRKRKRKLVMESSESCDTANSADTEDVTIQGNGGSPAGLDSGLSGVHHPRRSFRKRQHVSYKESLGGSDDFESPLKRSRGDALSRDNKEELNEESCKNDNSTGFAAVDGDNERIKQKGYARPEEGLLNRSGEINEEETVMPNRNAKTSKVHDSESDSDSSCAPDPVFYDCPDSEFNDFDKDREENCFAVDQIWACYDTTDGMPRFYARVRKVFSPGFRLQFTWLEASSEDQDEINWISENLPVACGKFVHGNTEETMDRLTFSHQIHFEKGRGRCSYMIYPRKGQIWALFKNWDISWSSDPENHKRYKFEIVEIISDYVEDAGLRVAYLDKVEGFGSVFQRRTGEGIVSFLIPPTELLRFSHQIPSFNLMGTEREGIPEGSFELDPASLTANFDECGVVKMEAESLDVKANGSNNNSLEKGLKSMKSAEKLNTPEKCVGIEGKNDFGKETFILRRSPRALKNTDKKHNQMDDGQCPTQEGTAKDLGGDKDKKHGNLTPSKGSTPSFQGDERTNFPTKDRSPHSFAKDPCTPRSFSPGRQVFHNFHGDKSEGKFKPGQIWALYNDEDQLPKTYCQVKKIGSSPFQLHVTMLEACDHVCAGTFKLQTGKARVYAPGFFSHMLKADPIGKNRFNIFPRRGEIWALFNDWNADMSCSDLKKGKYEIIEVLEDKGQCFKFASLTRINGFKSIYKARRELRSSGGEMEIRRNELARFSHQIPSFKLTEEKNSLLRDCWELDPASIPDFCT